MPQQPAGQGSGLLLCRADGQGRRRDGQAEQEEQHQEWGLVMVVPQAVDDSMADMGKKTQFGTEQTGGWRDAYRALGFQDGRRFDPASRLSDGVPGQLMIGG